MISDSPYKKALVQHKKRRSPDDVNKFYTDAQKLEAVTTYFLLGGNLALTARKLKINEGTMRQWKYSNWWKDFEKEIRQEERLQLSSKLKKIIGTSWEAVEDRLEHGDFVFDQKAGEVRRKPVSMRDASHIALEATKLQNTMDLQADHSVASEAIEDKLSKLAKAFSDLAKGIKPEAPADDIEYVERVDDAIHEEREA